VLIAHGARDREGRAVREAIQGDRQDMVELLVGVQE
jgi:hypothetical protein